MCLHDPKYVKIVNLLQGFRALCVNQSELLGSDVTHDDIFLSLTKFGEEVRLFGLKIKEQTFSKSRLTI